VIKSNPLLLLAARA